MNPKLSFILIALIMMMGAAPAFADQWATLNNGVITGLYTGLQTFTTTVVPDNVSIGWTQVNGVWQKSATLLAAESTAADLAIKRQALTDAVATLRTWSDDADAAVAAWNGWDQPTKNAAMKTVLQRLAVFFDRFADSIETK